MIGVVQEQHAERAQLYKQWKQYDFPIVQDATTQLDLWVVPIPLLIDEHGVIQSSRFRSSSLKEFVNTSYDEPEVVEKQEQGSDSDAKKLIANANLAIHGATRNVDNAIKFFSQAVKAAPSNGKAHFGLGVAYRMRFDSDQRKPGDFEKAYSHWKQALKINPNQYIWRRRIEQYGPKLTKPYPFYNWVSKANEEIKARGEQPVVLTAPLSGTETALNGPTKTQDESVNPDPEGKVFADENNFVTVSSLLVPSVIKGKNTMRVHLEFEIQNAKWNEEADPLTVWIDKASDGQPDRRLVQHTPLKGNLASSSKSLDFEFSPTDKKGNISGFALFHSCDDDGVCFYYRKEFQIPYDLK